MDPDHKFCFRPEEARSFDTTVQEKRDAEQEEKRGTAKEKVRFVSGLPMRIS